LAQSARCLSVARTSPFKMPHKAPSDLELVSAVLADSDEYPSSTASSMRAMLANGLAGTVAALQEKTGEPELPQEFLGLVGKVLHDALAQCLSGLKEKEADAAAALVQCEASDSARDLASAALEEAMVKLQGLKAELIAAKSAEVKEKCSYSEVQAATQSILDGHAALEEQLARSQRASQAAQNLESGLPAESRASTAELVLEHLAENGAEQALQAAAGSALSRPLAERHPFDVVTLDVVKTVLGSWQAGAAEKVATSAPSAVQARAEVLGAWAILDAARDQIMTVKEAIGEAEKALEQASQSFTVAETQAKSLRQALSRCLVQQTLAESSAGEINKALAALSRLADATAAAPAEATQDVKMAEYPAAAALVEGRRVATAGAGRA